MKLTFVFLSWCEEDAFLSLDGFSQAFDIIRFIGDIYRHWEDVFNSGAAP